MLMSKLRRFLGTLVFIFALTAGTAALTTRAADQNTLPATAPVPGTRPAAPAAHRSGIAPATPTPSRPATTRSPAPGAPQVPEESATIRDDPTVAPDPKQSADNNVSFPTDI